MEIKKRFFGRLPDGSAVDLLTLANDNGLEAELMTLGAILVSLRIPDRRGDADDITLGYDSLEGYLENRPYFGAIIGRYANRIAKGRFVLNGVDYKLATNSGLHHLHGGVKGFDKVLWRAEPARATDVAGVRFTYFSRDGEEGYPGNLDIAVTYSLTNRDELQIVYEAQTDKATPVNMTHHSYFNLAGQGKGDILGHELVLNADQFVEVDEDLIPTGRFLDVEGTDMDFRKTMAVGSRIAGTGDGYDHTYIRHRDQAGFGFAARVHERKTGRLMEIYTTEPGVQFYSGNFLDDAIIGKGGARYPKHSGFCLETQHFPDSPNRPNFPSTILEPGRRYSSMTVFKFSAGRKNFA